MTLRRSAPPATAGASLSRRRARRARLLLSAALAFLPAAAAAQVHVRPLTEEEVRRAIPVLRVLATGSEEARGEERRVEKAFQQAGRSGEAALSGKVDPVSAFREAGGDRLVPAGFRIHEACSRSLTEAWSRPTVVATAGFANDWAAKRTGGCGPGGKPDPALNQKSEQAIRAARTHLAKQGFEEEGPRLVGKRFAAVPVPGNCFRASPGRGCADLPSGPCVAFTDEAPLRSLSQAAETQQAGQQDREARVARAAEAAGFTPQDLDDLRMALGIAAQDARDPGRLDALAAIPGELGATAGVRRKNLAVYRKLEGEVAPLLDAIRRPP